MDGKANHTLGENRLNEITYHFRQLHKNDQQNSTEIEKRQYQ